MDKNSIEAFYLYYIIVLVAKMIKDDSIKNKSEKEITNEYIEYLSDRIEKDLLSKVIDVDNLIQEIINKERKI